MPPHSEAATLLKEGARTLGLSVEPPVLEQLLLYLAELKRWNAKVNLTGLRTDRDIVSKHFLDSLAVLQFLGEAPSLADLGSGAGFPGLVLKILRPEMTITLVESRGKKAAFLEYVASVLKLTGVTVAQVRLTPQLTRKWGPRFAAVTSRATFALPRLVELAAPLLLPGGRLLALKGPGLSETEMSRAGTLAQDLGLTPLELLEYNLPLTGEPRLLVRAERTKG